MMQAMTEPTLSRYRRRAQTLASLRQLAREAAEAGEPLAAIAARLNIPRTTLSNWARADGFRTGDLKARAAAAEAVETEANRVRREAEDLLAAAGLNADASPVKREVDQGRARVSALLDAGLIPEAEADMRKARRLQSLISFAPPVTFSLSTAQEAAHEARGYAFEWRLMLKVCEAWHDGLEGEAPVRDGSMRFDAMYMHRCHMVWDVFRFLYGPDPEYEAELMLDIYARAETGWFVGFRQKMRDAVEMLRECGNDEMANDLEGKLAAEAIALRQYTAYDAAMGYARPAQ
mgnify:FL=1|tara:strand:+ start:748 stop:1617 length:870 start_codon:yes stop_codon:yes gene_type:complete